MTALGREAERHVAAVVAAKRERVSMASTVLDPLPSTTTADTALLLAALDGAREVLVGLGHVVALSTRGHHVVGLCTEAAERLRARIREDALDG